MPQQAKHKGRVSQRAKDAKQQAKLFVAPQGKDGRPPKAGHLGPWAALAALKRKWSNGGRGSR